MFTRDQIVEALNTVLEINEDDTKRVAFFSYSGHTKGIMIDIYPDGWSKRYKKDHVAFFDYEDLNTLDSLAYHRKKEPVREKYTDFDQMLVAVRKVGL